MFTSYAQNFEDVILWRALGHITDGFYIDVGACDPDEDSVSRAFYEHGWRGIHVEPNPDYADRLRSARPDEDVVEAAVGEGAEAIAFHIVPGTGLSTGDAACAAHHAKLGHPVKDISVPCLPLSHILDRAAARDVHWLKIDVEGMEASVIRSWASSSVRPWVVVVEAVSPLPGSVDIGGWEGCLLGMGYKLAYFDGLNRFYVSEAQAELAKHFDAGPNVFDNFVLSGRSSAPFCSKLLADLAAAQQQAAVAKAAAEEHARSRDRMCEDLGAAVASLQSSQAVALKSLRAIQIELRDARRELQREQARRRQLQLSEQDKIAQCEMLRAEAEKKNAHTHAIWTVADNLSREVAAIRESRSWRMTLPLRWSARQVRRCMVLAKNGRARVRGQTAALPVVAVSIASALLRHHPRLRSHVLTVVRRVPGLYERIIALRTRQSCSGIHPLQGSIVGPRAPQIMGPPAPCTASARQAYLQLAAVRGRLVGRSD
jgi:FkbM family methyltransferase